MLTSFDRIALCALLVGATLAADSRAQWSTDSLSATRHNLAAVTSGDKTYFAGGSDSGGYSDLVDIYDASEDEWSTATLFEPRSDIAATAVGQYVLFAGGFTSTSTSSAVVDVLDTQDMCWSTTTLTAARFTAATTVGNKAIFAGGYGGGWNAPVSSNVVDIYDSDLGKPWESAAWSTTTLSVPRGRLAAATAGDLALFVGGRNDAPFGSWVEYDTVDVYNNSTDSWSFTTVPQARATIGAASTGTRAYFAGGAAAGLVSDAVDIYNSETGLWTSKTLSVARSGVAAVAVGDTVLFAGGFPATVGSAYATVDILNASTGVWEPTAELSAPKGGLDASSVDGKALFAGGVGAPTGASDIVEVYSAPWTDLGGGTSGGLGQPVFSGGGDLTAGSTLTLELSNAPSSAPFLMWISLSSSPVNVVGGTLYTLPVDVSLLLFADASGDFGISSVVAAGAPSGVDIWFQCIVQDATNIHGITLSNAMRGTTP
jgi:N-acetylneuraminic acid mutarotase